MQTLAKQFSVLMSLYSKENPLYLDYCFLSIYNQTLPCNELICVYDGPIGNELEAVVNNWLNKLPIKIIPLDKNVGLGNALNEGLKHCTYELVARMDTDDACLNTRFEQQIAYMTLHPDTAILGCTIYECESDITTITSTRTVPTDHNDIIEFAKLKNPFNHMSVMFKKSVVLSVGGYKHHYLMEDYNLWLRIIAKSYKVANLNNPLLMVRAGSNMIARRKGLAYVKSEYQLARLKYALHIQPLLPATFTFVLRSLPRVLPVFLLSYLYKRTRVNSN
ncbi:MULTISPECIES: glycosyltransferase family 2 protein [Rahnella]|jgi:amylovoran biosynthesis glycosyltransferase AmsE|uniref:glycosyltransferase family 2 protein n=1 Tax=Rahnella TaxID=34037 RepID=UPI000DD44654|nr:MULTISPECIES: glycosyltransferase [Rahnella]